jgi:hypothetical protein
VYLNEKFRPPYNLPDCGGGPRNAATTIAPLVMRPSEPEYCAFILLVWSSGCLNSHAAYMYKPLPK